MTIEAVVTDDIPNLKAISAHCLSVSVDMDADEKGAIIEHSASNIDDYALRADCVFLKSIREGEIAGFILIKQFWNLSDLFVLPEYQVRGVGGELLLNAMAQAKQNSDKMAIWVNSSLNAEGFYRKFGFEDRTQGSPKPAFTVPLVHHF